MKNLFLSIFLIFLSFNSFAKSCDLIAHKQFMREISGYLEQKHLPLSEIVIERVSLYYTRPLPGNDTILRHFYKGEALINGQERIEVSFKVFEDLNQKNGCTSN